MKIYSLDKQTLVIKEIPRETAYKILGYYYRNTHTIDLHTPIKTPYYWICVNKKKLKSLIK